MDISPRPRRPDKVIYDPKRIRQKKDSTGAYISNTSGDSCSSGGNNYPRSSGDGAPDEHKNPGQRVEQSRPTKYSANRQKQIQSSNPIREDVPNRPAAYNTRGSGAYRGRDRHRNANQDNQKIPNYQFKTSSRETAISEAAKGSAGSSKHVLPTPVSKASNVPTTDSDKQDCIKDDNARHGGLIHLPKSIDLNKLDEQSKTKYLARGVQRGK